MMGIESAKRAAIAIVVVVVMPAQHQAAKTAEGTHFQRLQEPLADFDTYVARAMRDWQTPGLAISVVKDGRVVHARGYGLCKAGGMSVTPDTLFPIASVTKSFTATAIGMLVDEKKLHWDDPVHKHIPDFKLYDPFVTREVTLRDLLAHRTGLELGNKLWSRNEFTPDEIMRRLEYMQPRYSFRSRFSYNSLMFLVAGRIVEKVSSQTWGKFVETRILSPTGMRSTTALFPEGAEIARPHAEIDGKLQAIELEARYNESIAPAGAMWSSANDMAKWLLLNLASGQIGDQRLLGSDTIDELHTSQVNIQGLSKGKTYPKQNFRSYGLGWFVDDYRGQKLVWHSGTRNGYVAWVAMLPNAKLGFVILANTHRTGINFALHHRILDAYLGQPAKDWSGIIQNDYSNGWQKSLREAREAFEKRRQTGAKPRLKLSGYAGTYESKLYGTITVRQTDAGLELRFGPRHVAILTHWQHETFLADFPNLMLEDWHVTFNVNGDRLAASLHAVEAPWAPAWYEDSSDLGDFAREFAHRQTSGITPGSRTQPPAPIF